MIHLCLFCAANKFDNCLAFLSNLHNLLCSCIPRSTIKAEIA